MKSNDEGKKRKQTTLKASISPRLFGAEYQIIFFFFYFRINRNERELFAMEM